MVEILTETIKFHGDELEGDELAFFKAQTKIQDDDEVKRHIAAVQAEAYKHYPYACIKWPAQYVVTTATIMWLRWITCVVKGLG